MVKKNVNIDKQLGRDSGNSRPGMDLNIFTLAFGDELEQKFRQDYFQSSVRLLRYSFFLGIIYYSSFAFLDVVALPEVKRELFIIRFYVVIPVILAVFLLSFTKGFHRWWQFAAFIATTIAGFGIVVMTVISPELGRHHYYPGVMLVLFYCYMLIKLRFVWASLAGWLIIIAYLVSTILFPGVDLDVARINLFFLVSANILGMFGGYALEFYARKDFFNRYLLKKESEKVEEANEKLEEKVREKTRSLKEDIQRRKLIEKELIDAKNRAEESDRLKSAFLANMSHEIRTPMNGILGFTELLSEPDLTGEQQKKYVEIIQKSGDRMLNTVNDLIDISRIETEQVQPAMKTVDVIREFQNFFAFFQKEAKDKDLQLFLDSKDLPEKLVLQTDPSLFESIMTNLLKNAIKYTSKGFIRFGAKLNENHVEFYVSDTGIGIPEERQDAIFDRFVQADIQDTKAFEGSGLGLSITKAYVELLGGSIWLRSEINSGSTFYFTHPLLAIDKKNGH